MTRWMLMVPVLATGCAAMKAEMPTMSALQFDSAAAPALLTENHFARDRSAISEADLKEILAAPVFLEEHARIGVVPVVARYEPDDGLPTEAAPATLVDSLDSSGMFELASEVSTEWPADRGLPGLRELAARYRTEYLLLFRHRFNDVVSANGWAVGYATLVGALVIPGNSLDAAGVLEATLYDVKTGTILFTVNERVRGSDTAAPPSIDAHQRELHRKLVAEAAPKLADQVIARCRRLVASRPATGERPTTTRAGQGEPLANLPSD